MSENHRFPFRQFFLLSGIEAVIAVIYLALIPTDPKNEVFMGFSMNRLIIFGIIITFLIFSVFQFWKTKQKEFEPAWFSFISKILSQIKFLQPVLMLFCWIIIFFPAYRFGKYEVIYSRVQPLLILIAVILFQFLLLLKIRIQKSSSNFIEHVDKRVLGIFLVIIIVMWVFLVTTRIGLDIDHDFWGGAATPILPLVTVLSLFIPFYLLFLFRNDEDKFSNFVKIFPIFLFFFAILIWNLEPFTPHFFAPKIRPPNYEYYPYSDAHIYDMTSQSLLSGEGYFNRGHVQRPLYGFILFVFHKLVGQNYLNVVFLQTVLYALFPVLFFYFGKRFFSPLVGISLGVLAALRELTALQASPFMEIVHSKLYMTDIWASFFALLITFLVCVWYFEKKENIPLLILIGGVMGISLLMRINLLLIFIPIFFVIFVKFKTKLVFGIQRIAILGLSIFVILLPWMGRNYFQVGEFGIEPQKFRMVIETRFQIDDNDDQLESQPGTAKPSPMIMPSKEGDGILKEIDFEQILNIAQFTTANFFHNEIHSILIFPNSIFAESIRSVIGQNDYIQESWTGEINTRQFVAIIVNLFLIGLGISLGYKKFGWFGLFPLSIHLFYNLSNGFARVSGWRYVIVTDWVIILYYLAGLIFLFSGIFSKLNLIKIHPTKVIYSNEEYKEGIGGSSKTIILVGIILVSIVSISLILPELLIKPKFQGEISKEKFMQMMDASDVEIEVDVLEEIADESEVVFIHSKAFYPRYFYEGEGEPGFNIEWMLARDYNQLNFMIVSPYITGVTMRLDNNPDNFPHGSEVYIIARQVHSQYGNFYKGEMVYLPDSKGILFSKIQ